MSYNEVIQKSKFTFDTEISTLDILNNQKGGGCNPVINKSIFIRLFSSSSLNFTYPFISPVNTEIA